SGTTALYEMLRRHPQIYMPELKEPVFFASELPRVAHRAWLPSTLEEYLSLFAGARPDQRVGEASATYLWSATAAQRIAAERPDARIVAILREPAALLRSLHLQNLQSHYETERDLGAALALEDARRHGRDVPSRCLRPQALRYSEYVRFAEQLRRYHGVFGRERVLVLLYDDFRRENEATVRRVLRFLGVDDGVAFEALEANPTVRVRSQRLDELVHSVSVGRGSVGRLVKGPVMALAPRRVRRGVLGAVRRRVVLASPPAVDHGLMLELRRRYLPEVLAVSEYLDRDLVRLWGYDRLG
ncbi:MAG: sulfotransferase, partial [Solirubrobacteraceae bacterium]